MEYIKAFVFGGLICIIGQILIDKTKLTPARILTTFAVIGVVLSAFGIYGKLVDMFGAGASVPILGFGHLLAKGTKKAVDELGVLGIFSGGIKETAAGLCASIFFGFMVSLIFNPKDKS